MTLTPFLIYEIGKHEKAPWHALLMRLWGKSMLLDAPGRIQITATVEKRNLTTANRTTQAPALDPATPVQGTSATDTPWTMQKHTYMRLFIAALSLQSVETFLGAQSQESTWIQDVHGVHGGAAVKNMEEEACDLSMSDFQDMLSNEEMRNESAWVPAASLLQCKKEQKIRKRAFMGK